MCILKYKIQYKIKGLLAENLLKKTLPFLTIEYLFMTEKFLVCKWLRVCPLKQIIG